MVFYFNNFHIQQESTKLHQKLKMIPAGNTYLTGHLVLCILMSGEKIILLLVCLMTQIRRLYNILTAHTYVDIQKNLLIYFS